MKASDTTEVRPVTRCRDCRATVPTSEAYAVTRRLVQVHLCRACVTR